MIQSMHRIARWFLKLSKTIKVAIILIVVGLGWFGIKQFTTSNNATPAYQTAIVEKDSLAVSVSVSGQVSGANSAEVTTQASGVIKTVFVKDGDMVKSGDKIAHIDLDLVGQQRSTQAYASYQSAQNNLATAKANLYTSQSTLLTEWESYMAKAQNATYENSDDSPNTGNRQLTDFVITQNDWLASEAKYKIQQNAILQAQSSLSSAWGSYQQSSPTIVAPIAGKITGLSLQPGTVINAQTNSSGGSSSQRIASVKTDALPTIKLNITQIDAPKIKAGNKATLTFDAFPDKTYTGEVVSIDTIGTETSGVTTYPAYIKLDTTLEGLLPNMSASASIITATKDNILIVPSTALTTTDGTTYIQVMKNKQVSQQQVTTGISSDSETEIISGINEGDTIVTSTTTPSTSSTTTQTSSPFSTFGRTGGNSRQGQMISR